MYRFPERRTARPGRERRGAVERQQREVRVAVEPAPVRPLRAEVARKLDKITSDSQAESFISQQAAKKLKAANASMRVWQSTRSGCNKKHSRETNIFFPSVYRHQFFRVRTFLEPFISLRIGYWASTLFDQFHVLQR